MVRYLILVFGLMLMLPLASVGQGKKEQVCAIRGAIYYTTFRQQADFTIFVEDSPDFADMQVYKERQRLFADKPGLWHFVDHPHLADYILFVEQNRSAADFTIAYTPTQSFAGCK